MPDRNPTCTEYNIPQVEAKQQTEVHLVKFLKMLKKTLLTWIELSPGFECFGRRVRISSIQTTK
jgi:hypothetical protein